MTVKLTPKGAATRDRIIQGASTEIRENGVTATLDDIRVRTGTSKSQLFHYFPDGREQLLLAVARYEADRVLADQQPQLGDLTSWASWLAWRDAVVARYREQGQQCPLSALTTQLGRATPGARAVVTELMGQWQAEIAAGVTSMQSAGEIASHFNISGPSMSHHFAVLKQADLINGRKVGQQILYSLNTTVIQDLVAVMLDLFAPKPILEPDEN